MATTAAAVTYEEFSVSANKSDGANDSKAATATGASAGPSRYADNDKSMSTKTDYYGIQFYAPPVIHGPAAAVDMFGRHLHQQHPPAAVTAYHRAQSQHQHHQMPWESTAAVLQQDHESSILQMNPLLGTATAADDPSTARYPGPRPLQQRPKSMARMVNYAEPLAFLAAEADDRALLDSLPALQFALQRATGKQQSGAAPGIYQQRRHLQRLPPPPPPPPPPQLHRLHHHHRYAPARYTQVPFLYNLPPPPPAQRQLAPAEYDLVTQFNRLLKQREREEDRLNDEDEEETATRPAAKPKKTKKKKKKKKKRARTTPVPPPPASVEEDVNEQDDKQQQQDDDRLENEQPTSEEQESQNVHTSEKLPDGTVLNENEAESQNVLDEPALISEQFGGDLTFEDGEGERVEFQLHGLGGPESYKFGFDTGKGSNRQFRYEERDSGGNVRGHYGYLDGEGKMQVYNYSSHPELGFQAQKSETLEV
ncbi:Insect cuticle protein [Cinara cedri]|uniref:Insect cuticle protein n=1 Tax=Cinara cedri TaxID=506608 RepID=A0A5E4M381_9HEMI|nr:Insect cuticle protein [Cinara cedri]